jgi:hypothetical protein
MSELEVQRQEEKLAFSKSKKDRMKARDQLSQATQTIAQIEKNFYDREESDDEAEDLEESDENMDEQATMKKYFTKSAVYKRFKAEEEKELTQMD